MTKQMLSKEFEQAAKTPTHTHDWEVGVGDGVFASCKAPFCNARLDWDEIERRCNVVELLPHGYDKST
jgi:hypothetical protein